MSGMDLTVSVDDLYKGMTLRIENRPDGEAWTVRVADVVDNKDGTFTVTTEPITDGWEPVAYTLSRNED